MHRFGITTYFSTVTFSLRRNSKNSLFSYDLQESTVEKRRRAHNVRPYAMKGLPSEVEVGLPHKMSQNSTQPAVINPASGRFSFGKSPFLISPQFDDLSRRAAANSNSSILAASPRAEPAGAPFFDILGGNEFRLRQFFAPLRIDAPSGAPARCAGERGGFYFPRSSMI